MHECTLSLISSSSELLFSSSSEDWLGPTTVKWFYKPSKKKQKQKSCDNSNTAWDAYFHSTTYMYMYGSIFENFKGKGSQWGSQRGKVGKYMHGHPPPPPKKKIYIIYKFLAAYEYKIAAGLQRQN